jgi:hypothetical protein
MIQLSGVLGLVTTLILCLKIPLKVWPYSTRDWLMDTHDYGVP